MNKPRPVLCYCSLAFRDQPIEEIIPRLADIGYDGVEIFAQHINGKTDAELDAIRRLAESKKLRIEVVSPYFWLTRDLPDLVKESIESAARFAGYARRLGAKRIRTFVDAGNDGIGSAVATPEQWQRAVTNLKKITSLAPDILFVVETHAHTLADTPVSTRRLFDLVQAANLKVLYQADGVSDPLIGYRLLKPDIQHFHLQHPYGPEKTGYLNDGSEYLTPLFAEVLRDGYSGTMSVEHCWKGPTWDHAAADRAWLKQRGI
ncbi:MAG: sugar phosphate isomerase/epimerase family protein [Planctomycetota bacterium]